MANVVVLDDESSVRDGLGLILKRLGHSTALYNNPSECIESNETWGFLDVADIIITDFQMAGETALDILKYVKENNLHPKIIVNSGWYYAKEEIDKNGYSNLITSYMNKESSIDEIKQHVNKALGVN